MKKDNRTAVSNLLTYGFAHAAVDATCAAVLLSNYSALKSDVDYFAFLVLLYNVLAFSLQAPFGLLFDKLKKPVASSITGCLLTVISVVLSAYPLTAVIFAGFGNALFHVGGGIISLNLKPGKASMPGIYVAPGALGLMIGTLVGKNGYFVAWPFIVILIISAIIIYFIKSPQINYGIGQGKQTQWFELIIILLLISVTIRSLLGLAVDFPWKSNIYLLVCLTLAVVLGKALGGIIADKFGWKRVSVISLLLSAPLISFGVDYPVLAIAGIFLFNITMPVTLTAIANMLPGTAGFSFGLTTLALVTGALPTFTKAKLFFNGSFIVFATILLSSASLYIGLRLYFSNKKYNIIKNNSSVHFN